jgi:hypothetical protein
MKKLIYTLVCTVLFSSFLVGCSKSPTNVLPKKDGTWTFVATQSDFPALSINGTAVFTKTNYTFTVTGSSAESGTWSYDKTGKKITLVSTGVGGTSTVMDVTEATRKTETWSYSEVDNSGTSPVTITYTYKFTKS